MNYIKLSTIQLLKIQYALDDVNQIKIGKNLGDSFFRSSFILSGPVGQNLNLNAATDKTGTGCLRMKSRGLKKV